MFAILAFYLSSKHSMKIPSFLSFFLCVSLIIFSLPALSITLESQVLADISKRSHIPANKLKILFIDCDRAKNQLTMDLCADKDATTAIFKLKQILLNKKAQLSNCQSQLKKNIIQWKKLRDKDCENATEDYNGGSIRPFIEMTCLANETTKLLNKFNKINNCNEINKIIEPLQINKKDYSMTNGHD